jgi:hypothetical protein
LPDPFGVSRPESIIAATTVPALVLPAETCTAPASITAPGMSPANVSVTPRRRPMVCARSTIAVPRSLLCRTNRRRSRSPCANAITTATALTCSDRLAASRLRRRRAERERSRSWLPDASTTAAPAASIAPTTAPSSGSRTTRPATAPVAAVPATISRARPRLTHWRIIVRSPTKRSRTPPWLRRCRVRGLIATSRSYSAIRTACT